MNPGEPAIELLDLHLAYGGVQALRGLSLELHRGEILGLLGPNGAGKTSAIECLLGLRQPDAGSIRILGRDLNPNSQELHALIGAQLQDASLQDKLSPLEAIQLFGAFQPVRPDALSLLQRFGLQEKANAHFQELSDGQKRRLFLALAFLNDPQVLVLDEPSAGLDPRSREELHLLIRGLRQSGRSVLLSTHYLEEAEQLCDRVALIDAGRLVALDSPATLIARSKALPRLRFRCLYPKDPSNLEKLLGSTITILPEGRWELATRAPNAVLATLTRHLETLHNPLLELQILQPTLADVFLELTGNEYATRE